MNATIEKIVNLLFEDLAESDEVAAIREEILQNCQERYQDLREAGIGEDESIHAVIESLNGMEEMLEGYPRKDEQPAEPIREEPETERRWNHDPAQSPITEIRMERMGRANVYVCESEDDQLHVVCSNPELTLITGQENGVLSIGISEEKPEDIKISVDDLKSSIEKGFDLSSIGRFFEKLGRRFTASVSDAEVTLSLPAALSPTLSIHTASGNVTVDSLAFPKLQIGTASGDVEINDLKIEKELRVVSASGDITISDTSAQQLHLSSTSGDVEVNSGSVQDTVRINTTSGDIGWYSQCQTLDLSSISGDLTQEGSVENVSFKTVSGDVHARPQGEPLHSVNVKTTSGDISVTLPQGVQADVHCHTVSGGIHNHVSSAPGAAVSISLSTVSGDLSIQ